MGDTTPSTSGPLQGIRILDMATVLAAPFAATLCGDMGAEVTKLELPDGSDTLRHMLPVLRRAACHPERVVLRRCASGERVSAAAGALVWK